MLYLLLSHTKSGKSFDLLSGALDTASSCGDAVGVELCVAKYLALQTERAEVLFGDFGSKSKLTAIHIMEVLGNV